MASHPYDYSFALKKELQKKILLSVMTVVLLCVFIQLILMFLIFPVNVKTSSMSPEYEDGSLVFVVPYCPANPLFFQRYHIQRGSVVYVDAARKDDLPFLNRAANFFVEFFSFRQATAVKSGNSVSSAPSIRRVVGLPGDTLYMKEYVLYVKPAGETHFLTEFEVADRMYEIDTSSVTHDRELGVTGTFDEITLGDDEYFLLADARTVSLDSRLYGPVPASRIIGKAILRYFPFDAFSTL